jgi:hypothetical protein
MLGISLMLGCSGTARLYPVHGPLSAQTPLPVFPGKLSGWVNAGNISFAMSDGEVCKGRWTRVGAVNAPNGAATANIPATNGMASVWDAIYGSGFYVSHILGSEWYGQAVVTGDRGTILKVEFYSWGKRTQPIGVAKDNKDNIYKMVFPRIEAR